MSANRRFYANLTDREWYELEKTMQRRKEIFRNEVSKMLKGFGLKVVRKDKEQKNEKKD